MRTIIALAGVVLIAGCAPKPKPELDYKQAASHLAMAQICMEKGGAPVAMGLESRANTVAWLNSFQYDQSQLSRTFNIVRGGFETLITFDPDQLTKLCGIMEYHVLSARRDLEQRQRLASENRIRQDNALAQMAIALQGFNQGVNPQVQNMLEDNYIPEPNFGVNQGGGTQHYLINGEGGLQRRTCTESGSYRHCF